MAVVAFGWRCLHRSAPDKNHSVTRALSRKTDAHGHRRHVRTPGGGCRNSPFGPETSTDRPLQQSREAIHDAPWPDQPRSSNPISPSDHEPSGEIRCERFPEVRSCAGHLFEVAGNPDDARRPCLSCPPNPGQQDIHSAVHQFALVRDVPVRRRRDRRPPAISRVARIRRLPPCRIPGFR